MDLRCRCNIVITQFRHDILPLEDDSRIENCTISTDSHNGSDILSISATLLVLCLGTSPAYHLLLALVRWRKTTLIHTIHIMGLIPGLIMYCSTNENQCFTTS